MPDKSPLASNALGSRSYSAQDLLELGPERTRTGSTRLGRGGNARGAGQGLGLGYPELVDRAAVSADQPVGHAIGDGEHLMPGLAATAPAGSIHILASVVSLLHGFRLASAGS